MCSSCVPPIGMEAQVRLMANMMLFAQTAETAEVAEDELYVPFKEIIYSSNTQSGTHTGKSCSTERKSV